jgi:hypothetical protein
MRKTMLAAPVVLGLSLTGCGGVPVADVTACVEALVASGSFEPAALLAVALGNASCQALAKDVLDGLIKSVSSGQQRAAAKAMMRR